MIAIRTLSPDDWSLWRALRLSALAESPAAFGAALSDWQGTGDSEPRWRSRLTHVPFNVVAALEESWVGMASGTAPEASSVELISMWVSPQARGQGVGDRLIREVAEWARRQGAERLVLRVHADNTHGLSLYRRNQFVVTDTIKARSAGRADELALSRALQTGDAGPA